MTTAAVAQLVELSNFNCGVLMAAVATTVAHGEVFVLDVRVFKTKRGLDSCAPLFISHTVNAFRFHSYFFFCYFFCGGECKSSAKTTRHFNGVNLLPDIAIHVF